MKKKYLALLTAFSLLLALLPACGGKNPPPPPEPAPAGIEEPPSPSADPLPPPVEPEEEPEAGPETEPETPAPSVSDEPPSAETPDADAGQPDAPAPEPQPEPEPEPEPEPAETVPEDGAYTAAVTLEGGTGRAKVESPAALRCEDGRFWATIVWSSSNFDYMKVDGEKYELISEPGGNSTFEIPVAAYDQKLDVIADTVAMSEPHEVEYTLLFDSATLQKQ